jgi:hypothetical protein
MWNRPVPRHLHRRLSPRRQSVPVSAADAPLVGRCSVGRIALRSLPCGPIILTLHSLPLIGSCGTRPYSRRGIAFLMLSSLGCHGTIASCSPSSVSTITLLPGWSVTTCSPSSPSPRDSWNVTDSDQFKSNLAYPLSRLDGYDSAFGVRVVFSCWPDDLYLQSAFMVFESDRNNCGDLSIVLDRLKARDHPTSRAKFRVIWRQKLRAMFP